MSGACHRDYFIRVIKAIVFRFMDLGYTLTIHFSLKALITTFLSVIAIYFFALIDSGQFLKTKIVDLMSFDRENQLLQLKGRRQKTLSIYCISTIYHSDSFLYRISI